MDISNDIKIKLYKGMLNENKKLLEKNPKNIFFRKQIAEIEKILKTLDNGYR